MILSKLLIKFRKRASLGSKLRRFEFRYRGRDLSSVGLLEGDPAEVLGAVAKHASNRKIGVEDNINVAIFYCGGGAAGADGIGFAMALQLRHLTEGCRTVVGISTGSHIAAAHVTKQLELGCWSYRNVVTNKEFISFWNGFRSISIDPLLRAVGVVTRQRNFIDVERPIRVYSGQEKTVRGAFRTAFNVNAHTLIMPVTQFDTGVSSLVKFDAQRPDFNFVLDTIHASSALPPPLYWKAVSLPHAFSSDCRLVDGGMANPIPIERVQLEMTQSGTPITHIIVVLNSKLELAEPSIAEKFTVSAISWLWSKQLQAAYGKNLAAYRQSIARLRTSGTPYIIVSATGALGTFTNDRRKISKATLEKLDLSLSTLRKHTILEA